MAINFPNSPVNGNTYDYLGIRYTFNGTVSPGYWYIATTGNNSQATGAEVTAGTNDFKFVTPKAMEDSDYWNAHNDGPTSGLAAETSARSTKLETARTIDITGDITATAVAFDGTANIAISAAVNNDSHSHTGSTISGLDAGDVTTGVFNSARIPATGSDSSKLDLVRLYTVTSHSVNGSASVNAPAGYYFQAYGTASYHDVADWLSAVNSSGTNVTLRTDRTQTLYVIWTKN